MADPCARKSCILERTGNLASAPAPCPLGPSEICDDCCDGCRADCAERADDVAEWARREGHTDILEKMGRP
jgi:hypothetical protein